MLGREAPLSSPVLEGQNKCAVSPGHANRKQVLSRVLFFPVVPWLIGDFRIGGTGFPSCLVDAFCMAFNKHSKAELCGRVVLLLVTRLED